MAFHPLPRYRTGTGDNQSSRGTTRVDIRGHLYLNRNVRQSITLIVSFFVLYAQVNF